MSFRYTLVFSLELRSDIPPQARQSIEYLMLGRYRLPDPVPDDPFFLMEEAKRPFASAYHEYFPDVFDSVLISHRARASGELAGYRMNVRLPGLRLNEVYPFLEFLRWVAQFAEESGPVGFQFSPEMPDAPPMLLFVFEGRLSYEHFGGHPKQFPSGAPLQPNPYEA